VPGLPQLLEEKLPEAFKEKLTKKDTIVTDSSMSFTLADRLISIQPLAVTAEGFNFNGKGSLGFDRKYDFDGTFVIPKDLSSEMVGVVAQLQTLLNNSQQIQLPLKISGQGSSVSFVPDIVSMGAAAIENKVGEQLDKTLKNIFGQDDQQTNSTTPSQGALQQPNQKSTQPAGSILDTIRQRKGRQAK